MKETMVCKALVRTEDIGATWGHFGEFFLRGALRGPGASDY